MGISERPISVTVVAVILIEIGSGLLLWAASLNFHTATGKRVYVFNVWFAALGAVHLIPGIAIRRGYNWGRLLYLCSTPILVALDCVVFCGFGYRNLDIYLIGAYLVFLVLLVRPSVSAFFKHRNFEE